MKNIVDSIKHNFIYSVVKNFIVCYGMAFVLATISGLAIWKSLEILTQEKILLENISESDIPNFVIHFFNQASQTIPLGELLDSLFKDGIGTYSSVIDFFTDFERPNFGVAWGSYCKYIFRDLTVLALAGFPIDLFKMVKKCFSSFAKLLPIVFLFLTPLFLCASYCVSECILFLLEKSVFPGKASVLHLIVLLTVCGIHTVCKAFLKSFGIFKTLIALLLKLGFDSVRAILGWFWIATFPSFYLEFSFSNLSETFEIWLSLAVIFWIIEKIENYTVHQYEEKS